MTGSSFSHLEAYGNQLRKFQNILHRRCNIYPRKTLPTVGLQEQFCRILSIHTVSIQWETYQPFQPIYFLMIILRNLHYFSLRVVFARQVLFQSCWFYFYFQVTRRNPYFLFVGGLVFFQKDDSFDLKILQRRRYF